MKTTLRMIAVALIVVTARCSLFAQDKQTFPTTDDIQGILRRRIDVEKQSVGIVV